MSCANSPNLTKATTFKQRISKNRSVISTQRIPSPSISIEVYLQNSMHYSSLLEIQIFVVFLFSFLYRCDFCNFLAINRCMYVSVCICIYTYERFWVTFPSWVKCMLICTTLGMYLCSCSRIFGFLYLSSVILGLTGGF